MASVPSSQGFQVAVGDHVVLADGEDEVGAIRAITRDHVVVYIEGAGDFIVTGDSVRAAHAGKLVLDPDRVEPRLLEAARLAHQAEED
jgi:glyoxylase-like metal-dependent hydrolase (beta-lactamase superfamily II)